MGKSNHRTCGFSGLTTRTEPRPINSKCNMKPNPETANAYGVGSSERVVPLALEATRAAAEWEPFTQNHDPLYWKALREAYMQGYISGTHAEEKRHNTVITGESASPVHHSVRQRANNL